MQFKANSCQLGGRMTRDPYINEQGTFAAFDIAADGGYAGKDEQTQYPIYNPVFMSVKVLDPDLVNQVSQFGRKGCLVFASGYLETEYYKDSAQNDCSKVVMYAQAIGLPEEKQRQQQAPQGRQGGGQQRQQGGGRQQAPQQQRGGGQQRQQGGGRQQQGGYQRQGAPQQRQQQQRQAPPPPQDEGDDIPF